MANSLQVLAKRDESPYDALPARTKKRRDRVNVVVETPRGCRNKFKFDEKLNLFRLNAVLPAGSVFPFDFGYIAGTRAEDGDPLDVLVLIDEPAFTGCVVEARLIGVMEAEQTEDGTTTRNDRLLAVASDSKDHESVKTAKDLDKRLLEEIEHFFVSYNQLSDKKFKILGLRGPKAAAKCLERAERRRRRDG